MKLILRNFKLNVLPMVLLAVSPARGFEEPHSPPGKSIAASGAVELAITPGNTADLMVINALRRAREQILVQAFSFTHREIARALIKAKKRRVDVQLIADSEQTDKLQPKMMGEIAAADIPTYLDSRHQSAPNNIMATDAGNPEAAVATGSFNFIHAAQFKNAVRFINFRGNPQIATA